MQIKKIQIMAGPNYWSVLHHKLIVITLDIKDDVNPINSTLFKEKLKNLTYTIANDNNFPILSEFLKYLDEKICIPEVIKYLSILLQTVTNIDSYYGEVKKIKEFYKIIISYQIKEVGLYSIKNAVKIVHALLNHIQYTDLTKNIDELKNLFSNYRLGPSTEAITAEAQKRDIPYSKINGPLIILGYGNKQKIFSATLACNTSAIGVDIAADKKLTKEILEDVYIPSPVGMVASSINDLTQIINKIGFPLVVKPRYGNHGKGITTNINSLEKAQSAFTKAQKISSSVIVERFIEGTDYRILLINFKVVAVAKRIPPYIIGDGKKSVKELIIELNQNPLRGNHHENMLTQIKIDEMTDVILKENYLTVDSILEKDSLIYLKETANISTGGTAEDVTESFHPFNIFLAERIAKLTKLNVCGIDVIAKDVSQPMSSINSAILEVNAAPGFRMHLSPLLGKKRNVAKCFVDMHYPKGTSARIPIIAVTGTNGKTTVVRLINHLALQENLNVGMCTTDGIYINNYELFSGDCSGPKSAFKILRDPTVEYAVLECARGGILRSGLAFDKCDISIVTNISSDHLGMDGIETLEDLAKVKVVVPKTTFKNGYAILNAEDKLVYGLISQLECNIALFSTSKNVCIVKHINENALCCYIDNNAIFLTHQNNTYFIAYVHEIPLTFNGYSTCMKQNILPAILAAWISNFSKDNIIRALKSFTPSPENLPGRMNVFKFQNCKVMIDYAHNAEAFAALKEYLKTIDAKRKIGIIAANARL